MTILLSIFLVEIVLLVRLFSFTAPDLAGLHAGFLAAVLITQGVALSSLCRNAVSVGWERGMLSVSAIFYAISAGAPAWATPRQFDVLAAAALLLLLAPLALDPSASPGKAEGVKRILTASHGQRLGLVFGLAAVALALSAALAPLLHAAAGGAAEAIPSMLNALRRSGSTPVSGGSAVVSGNSGRTLLYGLDAEAAHKVGAGVRDPGPHLPVVYIEPVGMRSLPLRATRRLYVRVMTYDAYVDGFWITRAKTQRMLRDEDDGTADGRITFSTPSGASESYTVYTPPLASGVLPMIPRVTAVQLPRAVQLPNEIIASPVLTKADWLAFTAESAPLCWEDLPPGQSAPGRDNTFCWMQRSPLSDRLSAEAARIAPGRRNTTDAVTKVVAHLRDTCTYSTDEQGLPDVAPVESFLFSTRRGHCELFATSCALLLRSLGVPCRFSLGYSGGTYDASRRLYAFHADEYHAWVEVLTGKHGWVIIDPTPPGASGAPLSPAQGTIDAYPAGFTGADLADLISRTRMSAGADAGASGRTSFFSAAWLRAVFWFSALLAAGMIAVTLWTSRRRARAGVAAVERHRPVRTGIGFFDAMCRHFARRGMPMRATETPLEYLTRLKRAGLAGDSLDDAVTYFCDVCFGAQPRNAATEDRFLRQVREGLPCPASGHRGIQS